MRKQFFTPLFVGSFIGLAFIGYTVFAQFQPPTAVPPQANIAPPLNTSDTEQSKEAGLIVNLNNVNFTGLQVHGYLQLDTVAGAPPSADCNVAEAEGRMKFDPGPNTLYICSGVSGWVSK